MADIYDGAFRTIINDCSRLLIPFVNELFGESYSGNEEIDFYPNEHMLDQQDGPDKKRITDTNFSITWKNLRKKYHLECESSPFRKDRRILIRIFEYDAQIALDTGKVEGDTLRVSFPKTGILFLRGTSPEIMHVEVTTPGGSVVYDVAAARMADYSLEEIFRKKLYILIPFYIFNCERDFRSYDKDSRKLEELKGVYRNVIERLDVAVENGEISSFDKRTIIELADDVLKELAEKYENLKKGMGEIMSGEMIYTDARKILDTGLRQGRDEGLKQGRDEGRDEERREKIKEMLTLGRSPQDIADFCMYPIKLVKEVQKSMAAAPEG